MSNKNNRLFSLNQTLIGYLCASVIISSFFVYQTSAAELTLTDNLIVRDIDNKAVEHSFFSRQQSIHLTQGTHTLVIKYKDVFEDIDFAEERLITSDYFVVKFTVNNQKTLSLSTSDITDLTAAERFVKSPELSLLDEAQQEVILTLETLSDYELAKQVTKVVSNISVLAPSTDKGMTKDQQSFNNKVINKIDTLPMLKYWWEEANQAEKARFLVFINESTEK